MSKNRSPGLLQINKQDQKCLLAVNPIQNVVFYRGETIWFSSPVNKTVTSINRDPWKATCLRNLSFLLFVNNWTLKNITVSYVVKYTNDQCVHLLVISQRVQTKWSRNTYVSPCLSRLVIMRWPYVTRASFTLKMAAANERPSIRGGKVSWSRDYPFLKLQSSIPFQSTSIITQYFNSKNH